MINEEVKSMMTTRTAPHKDESLRLLCLGSSDAFNSVGRGHSSFWVDDADGAYLLDCGPSTPSSLQREIGLGRIDLADLDVIYITHLHGDHIGGLPVLLLILCFQYQRQRPLVIAGPKTTRERVDLLCEVSYPELHRLLSYELVFEERELNSEGAVGGRQLRSIEARHDPNAHPTSIRITDSQGESVAFSGDTGWSESLCELSAGASFFVLECSYADAVFSGHISLAEIEEVRERLTPTRLILTHFGEESRASASASQERLNLIVAEDGTEWFAEKSSP